MAVHSRNRNYDYTPLYKFLLAKVGAPWDEVFSEAVSRLDKPDAIYRMVDIEGRDANAVISVGERTFYSRLTIKDGVLVRLDENATPPVPRCHCCTHTFNGEVYS